MSSRRFVRSLAVLMFLTLPLACSAPSSTSQATPPPPTVAPSPPTAALPPPTAASVSPTAVAAHASDAAGSLTIEGVRLQLTSVQTQDVYEVSSQQKFAPNVPWDECLIIDASLSAGDAQQAQGWQVSVTDEKGRESMPEMTATKTGADGAAQGITWLFVVAKESLSFALHLPGGQTVQLDSLLPIRSAEASTRRPGQSPVPPATPTQPPVAAPILSTAAASLTVPYCQEAHQNGSTGGNTYLCLSSDAGDRLGGGQALLLTSKDSQYSFMAPNPLMLEISAPGGSWALDFGPPPGEDWRAGLYEEASMSMSESKPILNIRGNGVGCDAGATTGRFEILELARGTSSLVERFAANFEFHCDGQEPALWGYVRFNSTVP